MSRIADDLVKERDAFRDSLQRLGPNAPTACGDWTATGLAVHVAVGELRWGLPTVPFRLLVAKGVRLDRMARFNAAATRLYEQRGFDWAIGRLERPPPKSHLFGPVVTVSLLEVWAHHEDLLLANGAGRCASGVDLEPVTVLLRRYQRRQLDRLPDFASIEDEARFLAGRSTVEGVRLSI